MTCMGLFRDYFRFGIVAILLAITVFSWKEVLFYERTHPLRVTFLSVGQGDSILIQSPNELQMLIDGGPDTRVLEELSRVMPFGDRSIDVIIATHPDKDHIAGLIEVLSRFDVSYVIDPGVSNDTAVWREFEKKVEEENAARHIVARRGMLIDFGDGAVFRVLFPDRDLKNITDTNEGSVVGILDYGESEFMFTGDAPKNIEDYLVRLDQHSLQSDVLKLGHHGSRTSTDELFVSAVNPSYAIVSAGKDNSYGHPHEEVLNFLTKRGIQLFHTKDGAITFTSQGTSVVARQ